MTGIEAAIAELGSPKKVWLRGHVAEHCLLPALFKFRGGIESERRIIHRHVRLEAKTPVTCTNYLMPLLLMHDSYVPTRLLAWTESLQVALFCALLRESTTAAIFVLDPIALNADSNIEGIVDPGAQIPDGLLHFSRKLNAESLPLSPVAVSSKSFRGDAQGARALFTLHGSRILPLEEQCPARVRKVILNSEEKWLAEERLLSSWVGDDRVGAWQ
jgi:hypothetical protein